MAHARVVNPPATSPDHAQRLRALLLLAALIIMLALVLVAAAKGHIHILEAARSKGDAQKNGDDLTFADFTNAVDAIQRPANVALAALSGLGVTGGVALIALGSPRGLKTLGCAAGALAALAAGNGVIA
jgi:hypothetical protein